MAIVVVVGIDVVVCIIADAGGANDVDNATVATDVDSVSLKVDEAAEDVAEIGAVGNIVDKVVETGVDGVVVDVVVGIDVTESAVVSR